MNLSGLGLLDGNVGPIRKSLISNGVNIGTTGPGAQLHLYSAGGTSGVTTGLKVVHANNADDYVFQFTGNDGVAAQTMAMTQVGNVGPIRKSLISNGVNIGTTSPAALLHVNGNIKAVLNDIAATTAVVHDTTTKEIGYDVAELFEANEEVEPGDVLSIAENGNLKRSDQPYDSRVAGIASNAPAILFEGSQLQIAPQPFEFQRGNKPPLALAGRVLVKVTTENGPIKPGDLLTTSARQGYAMLAKDYKPGTILGKALEPLDKGTAKIKVLVTLQ